MNVYHLPQTIQALVFDMDLTLYSNTEYAQYQIDTLVEKLGQVKGLSFDEINREVDNVRQAKKLANNGKEPGLSGILADFGISVEEHLRWREEIFEPRRFINEDTRLKETLETLSSRFILGLVTNNPVLVARKTLAALGVEELFPIVVGLDTCMISKPHEKPFLKFCELSSCSIESCVSIGDRYDIDLDIPLQMGMGGILVDGVQDVYELPRFLSKKGGNYGI